MKAVEEKARGKKKTFTLKRREEHLRLFELLVFVSRFFTKGRLRLERLQVVSASAEDCGAAVLTSALIGFVDEPNVRSHQWTLCWFSEQKKLKRCNDLDVCLQGLFVWLHFRWTN